MRLTTHTDYGLRVLMTLGLHRESLLTVRDLAIRHRVSKNHLMKVVQTLVSLGLVRSVRGRGGGLRLAHDPSTMRIGGIVKALESDLALAACLGDDASSCVLSGACRLTSALRSATDAFFAELDRFTLHDLVVNRGALQRRLRPAA